MTFQEQYLPEPWMSVEEDPLTGLPNLLALIADLTGGAVGPGVAMAFDICDLGRINEREGRAAGDAAIVNLAKSMQEAASQLPCDTVKLYRIGGDEFCAVLRGERDDSCRFVISMCSNDHTPLFRYSLVPVPAETGASKDAFFEIWAAMEEGLQLQRSLRPDPMRHLASRLVEQVKETVDHLKASRRMAYTDDVSGLPNHRAARYLIRENLLSVRDPILSLLFVDGDDLKKYNENLGYEAGNEMIRKLGAILSGATLPGELVARWLSGDEFMVVLPGYAKEDALQKAKDICASVKEESACWAYPITVSIGVATYPDDAQGLDGLVAAAEEANAKAKSGGKDRVCGP
ncbi:MAG: diguanylate cyclase domain-containing protein [Bacillota bacterium]